MAPLSAMFLILSVAAAAVSVFLIVRTLFACADANAVEPAQLARGALLKLEQRVEAAPVCSRVLGRMRQRKRAQQMRDALPGAVQALHMALEAGSSPQQALSYAADNCDEPLATELARAVWGLKAGQTFDEAMEGVRRRARVGEFSFLTAALEIQHVTGGSLSTVLAAVSSSLQQAADLSEELKTKTTQGRTSARVVALMPLVLAGVLLLLSPGYYMAFFTTPLGIVFFVLACTLECLGIVLVRKVLALDVTGEARRS